MEKRLQSLKLPRDLTLGGTKPVKKTYVPNLNVVRNKEKAKEVAVKNGNKQREKLKDKKLNNKRHNESNGRFVQSTGIFSEGTTSDIVRKAYHSDRLGARDDTPTSMPVPTIKKETMPINEKAENVVLEELMACGDQMEDDKFLPFTPVTWNEKDFKDSKVPVKLEIKTELEETDISKKLKLENPSLSSIPEEFQDSDNVSDYNPVLTLWGLPDSFAGKSFSENTENKELLDYRLSDMLEGQIGKLVIRKSGKLEVYIGCVKYNLDQTELQSFTEEIVEINSQENQETLQSSVLGKIKSRFIVNPDWEHLLKNC